MHRILATLLLLPALFSAAQAQLTITQSDVLEAMNGRVVTIQHEAETFDGLPAILEAAGPNRTWDFTTMSFIEFGFSVSERVFPPVPGSNNPAFSYANIIIRSDDEFGGPRMAAAALQHLARRFGGRDSYVFYRLDPTGLRMLGFHGEDGAIVMEPAFEDRKLPMTFGTSWTSESTLGSEEPQGVTFTWRHENQVDGWGTLVTPEGSAAALRVRSLRIMSFEIPGFPVFADTTLAYDFITRDGITASVMLDGHGNVMGAGYAVASKEGTASEPGAGVPARAQLEAAYPNPFNPTTTVPFTLLRAGQVRLEVVDALGRTVATLVDDMRPAGAQAAIWNAAGVPSGVYFIRLTSAEGVEAQRVALLK